MAFGNTAYPAALDTNVELLDAVDQCKSTLNAQLNVAATSLTLVDASRFPSTGGYLLIESEILSYTGKSTNTLTGLTRGLSSTVDAMHTVGRQVTLVDSSHYHNQSRNAIIAIETELGIAPRGSYASVVARLNNLLDKTAGGTVTGALTLTANAILNGSDTITSNPPAAASNVGWKTTLFSTTHALGLAANTLAIKAPQWLSVMSGNPANGATTSVPDANAGISLHSSAATGIFWGTDTRLYRNASNVLRTPGSILADIDITATGKITSGGQLIANSTGSSVNDITQAALRVQPSASKLANYRYLSLFNATADTLPFLYIDNNGKFQFGPNNSSADTNFGRDGVGSLRTDTAFSVGTSLGIGVASASAIASSAAFQVDSTTKGGALPRLTTTQRDAIVTPIIGLEIFNTTLGKKQIFTNSGGWETITSTAEITPLPLSSLKFWGDPAKGVISDGAASFVGANSENLSVTNSTLNFGDIDWSISFYFKPSSFATNQYIFSQATTGSIRQFGIRIRTDQKVDLFIFDSAGTSVGNAISSVVMSAGTWYHVYAYHDSVNNIAGIVVNGTAVTVATTGVPTANAGKLDIGMAFGSGYLTGDVSGIGLWKRLLTSSEQTWLYNTGTGRSYDEFGVSGNNGYNLKLNLVSYWGLKEYSSAAGAITRKDYHGTNDLTDSNTVASSAGLVASAAREGDGVTQWTDNSGVGNHATQTTPSIRPVYRAADVNSKPSLQFAGAQYLLVNALSSLMNGTDKAVTVQCVVKQSSVGSSQDFCSWGRSSSAGSYLRCYNNGSVNYAVSKVDDAFATKNANSTSGVPDTNIHVLSFVIKGTTVDIYRDSTLIGSGLDIDLGITTINQFTIGALNRNTLSNFLGGYLCEMMIFDSALVEADRLNNEKLMKQKWGIA